MTDRLLQRLAMPWLISLILCTTNIYTNTLLGKDAHAVMIVNGNRFFDQERFDHSHILILDQMCQPNLLRLGIEFTRLAPD